MPLELGFEDLLSLPVVHRYLRAEVRRQRSHVLAERQRGSGIILEARSHRCGGEDGVPLREALQGAGIKASAHDVMAEISARSECDACVG